MKQSGLRPMAVRSAEASLGEEEGTDRGLGEEKGSLGRDQGDPERRTGRHVQAGISKVNNRIGGRCAQRCTL